MSQHPDGTPEEYRTTYMDPHAVDAPPVREPVNVGVGQGVSVAELAEMIRAEVGYTGALRFDPMAMLPFCGYNMADYFAHWLKVGRTPGAKLPKIFYVNWFRRDEDGGFLWPGFGENSRVLKWVIERIEGTADAVEIWQIAALDCNEDRNAARDFMDMMERAAEG